MPVESTGYSAVLLEQAFGCKAVVELLKSIKVGDMLKTKSVTFARKLLKMKRVALQLSVVLFLLAALTMPVQSQDLQFVRKHLAKLCGPEMYGRGYYKRGDSIAADYLTGIMKQLGVKAFTSGYQQPYTFVNNSISELKIKLNEVELKFSQEFMIDPNSCSLSGTFKPVMIKAGQMKNPDQFIKAMNEAEAPKVVVLDSAGLNNPGVFRLIKELALDKQLGITALVEVCDNVPNCSIGRKVLKIPYLQVSRKAIPNDLTTIGIQIKNVFNENYPTQNIIGYIPGQTDQYIVYTAHYDAMGSYGEGNYCAGAEDNASGTMMVLDLARQYMKEKKPYYSIAFMLFSGEEAGLKGSNYYVSHPLFPLSKIKEVINLDMVMTGQDGVFLFCGNDMPNEAAIVKKINDEHHYMKEVINRDRIPNSDHFPFYKNGVPAIFFLTLGDCGVGHTPDDTYANLPLFAYENFFKLVKEIPTELQKQEVR